MVAAAGSRSSNGSRADGSTAFASSVVSLSDPRLQLDPLEYPRTTTAGILAAWREVCRRKEIIERERQLALPDDLPEPLVQPDAIQSARQKYWEPVKNHVDTTRAEIPTAVVLHEVQSRRSSNSDHSPLHHHHLKRKSSMGQLSTTSSFSHQRKKRSATDARSTKERRQSISISSPRKRKEREATQSPTNDCNFKFNC
jgi:hypothetical protein